jgi:hypothetical protein
MHTARSNPSCNDVKQLGRRNRERQILIRPAELVTVLATSTFCDSSSCSFEDGAILELRAVREKAD